MFAKDPEAGDYAGFKTPGAEFSLHGAADLLPAFPPHTRMHAAVGDDLDIAVGEQ